MKGATVGSRAETYRYGEGEARVKKVSGGETTYYVGPHYEERWNNGVGTITKYYFAGTERIATRDSVEGLTFNHSDHLGSATKVTNTAGALIKTLGYKPFGGDVP
jgi:hypothetical protein